MREKIKWLEKTLRRTVCNVFFAFLCFLNYICYTSLISICLIYYSNGIISRPVFLHHLSHQALEDVPNVELVPVLPSFFFGQSLGRSLAPNSELVLVPEYVQGLRVFHKLHTILGRCTCNRRRKWERTDRWVSCS